MSGDPSPRTVASVSAEIALLNAEADRLRAEIAQLRREAAEVRLDIGAARDAWLVEANEQLVLAALHSESIAEAAVHSLGEVTRSSQRDPLTGIPSRALMLDRLESALAMAHRRKTRLAVFFVDLDDFKRINDTFGHAVGDGVLQVAARRLEAAVRHSDTVSRHGGDEFLVLLAEISRAMDAGPIAEKMLLALGAPGYFGQHVVHMSASIGIAVYPEDGTDSATLICRADAAMYRSKRHAPGNFAFHASHSLDVGCADSEEHARTSNQSVE